MKLINFLKNILNLIYTDRLEIEKLNIEAEALNNMIKKAKINLAKMDGMIEGAQIMIDSFKSYKCKNHE